MKKITLINLIILLIGQSIYTSCNSDISFLNKRTLPTMITVQGDKFVDDQGRQVILNGYNISNKNKEDGYIFKGGPELYENLNKWGVNCIRFIIIWDRLEPVPGVYNEQYLKEIDQRIALAKKK